MKLLKEFHRGKGLNLQGKAITREAVRAIIQEREQVLMVFSPVHKDYKFPGGGIKERESHRETLFREIQEECGVLLSEVSDEFGFVVEYSKAREDEYDIFQQISYYYLCKVDPVYVGQNLDAYEKLLGFRPEWVSMQDAIKQNNTVLKGSFGEPPRWTKRDTYVLATLAERQLGLGTVNSRK